jgi:hypothetical protein
MPHLPHHKPGATIRVHDTMQRDYSYVLSAPVGKQFAADFKPFFTPQQMLAHGVFEGKYMNDCTGEFPADWFKNAKLSDVADETLNCFGIKSRQPLSIWREKGWIIGPDPRGWFQWYCRYYMGRRMEDDARQIGRWKAMRRHVRQIERHCEPCDHMCRPRQRQALLHWAYDSRRI